MWLGLYRSIGTGMEKSVRIILSVLKLPACAKKSPLQFLVKDFSEKRRLSDFIPDCSGLPPVTHYPVCRQADSVVIGLIPIYRNRNGKNRFGLSSRFWNSVFVNKKKSLTISCKGLFGKTAAIYSPTINAVPSTWLGLSASWRIGMGGGGVKYHVGSETPSLYKQKKVPYNFL